MNNKFEQRNIGVDVSGLEFRSEGRTLSGYAATYNSESGDLGGFTEIIAPGAFRSVLQSKPDVVLNFNHDNHYILGRTGAGTLRLSEDDKGLRFEADLADTALIRDMIISPMERGELNSMSFAFRVNKDGQAWSQDSSGLRKRTINTFSELADCSVVARPAYGATSVALRSASEVLEEIVAEEEAEARAEEIQSHTTIPATETPTAPEVVVADPDYRIDSYLKRLQLVG